MHKLWEKRKPPTPLDFDEIKQLNNEKSDKIHVNKTKLKSQSVWSIEECLENFCNSINTLKARLQNLSENENKTLIWDKVI